MIPHQVLLKFSFLNFFNFSTSKSWS
jgi:hypothetical protein